MSLEMKLEKLKETREFDASSAFPISERELFERFSRLYTGAVNDVMREFAIVDQALPFELKPLVEGMAFVGPAFTITSAKDPRVEPSKEMELRAKMLSAIPKGAVCVWDTNQDNTASHWGGMMTASAGKAGAIGCVIDGGIRDVHQILKSRFPVFYRYRTPNGLLGRASVREYQVPIQIGSVIIYPGDIVFADFDGVMIIPRQKAYDILIRTEEICAFEKDIENWIEDGQGPLEIVKKGGYF